MLPPFRAAAKEGYRLLNAFCAGLIGFMFATWPIMILNAISSINLGYVGILFPFFVALVSFLWYLGWLTRLNNITDKEADTNQVKESVDFAFFVATSTDEEVNEFRRKLVCILSPVLLSLTLMLNWATTNSESNIVNITSQTSISFTGTQMLQQNNIILLNLFFTLIPVIQLALNKLNNYPFLPSLCFGIILILDLFIINDIQKNQIETDFVQVETKIGIGLILNLMLAAVSVYFSYPTTNPTISNEERDEEIEIEETNKIKEIEKLIKMKNDDLINDEEYNQLKEDLMKK